MTSYTKTTWVTGDVITAALLNNLELQYDDVFTGGTFTGAVVITLSSGTPLTASTTTTGDTLTLTNADAAALGVRITTLHNSASPAANDVVFRLVVTGKDSAGNTTTYGNLSCLLDDPVDTTEDSSWTLTGLRAGSAVTTATISPGNTVFNAQAFYAGAAGATNPAFLITATDASVATGLNVIGHAAAGGVNLTALSSGADEPLVINAKGAASTTINGTATGPIVLGQTTYINDTSNANSTIGLTINQGAADNEILILKSSDVAHGATSVTETDTYLNVQKASATAGGANITALSEAGSGLAALILTAYQGTNDTTKSSAASATVRIDGNAISGVAGAALAANTNILVVSAGNSGKFILDADGDSHQDVGTAWTNFDAHDDVALLDATAALLDPGSLRKSFTEDFLAVNKQALADARVVTFNADGHHFVNWSRFSMLHMGATRFLADKIAQQDAEIAALKSRLGV